ncbi:hypothetical protein ACWGIV_36690 [Streptomyces sp. NPDC054844]
MHGTQSTCDVVRRTEQAELLDEPQRRHVVDPGGGDLHGSLPFLGVHQVRMHALDDVGYGDVDIDEGEERGAAVLRDRAEAR